MRLHNKRYVALRNFDHLCMANIFIREKREAYLVAERKSH